MHHEIFPVFARICLLTMHLLLAFSEPPRSALSMKAAHSHHCGCHRSWVTTDPLHGGSSTTSTLLATAMCLGIQVLDVASTTKRHQLAPVNSDTAPGHLEDTSPSCLLQLVGGENWQSSVAARVALVSVTSSRNLCRACTGRCAAVVVSAWLGRLAAITRWLVATSLRQQ